MKFIDITGNKYGRLSVLCCLPHEKYKRPRIWKCVCECGNITFAPADALKDGTRKSCGCLYTKHGHARDNTRTYRIWSGMNDRCNNPRRPEFKHYGGRGITICPEWRDYLSFLRDMGEAPDGLELDRIDNEGSYCKENCRWSTRRQQLRNTRRSRIISANGKKMTVVEWSEETGISPVTISARLRRGWEESAAIFTPLVPLELRRTFRAAHK